jgi:hypothetical protein
MPRNEQGQSRNRTQSLPTIVITGRQMRDITAEALTALEAANRNPSIFVRSGKLCRLRQGGDRPIIETFNDNSLRGRLDRVANFRRRTTNGSLWPCSQPTLLVKDILSLEEWQFPSIQGIVELPVLRRDGSVLDSPGYDSSSQLYYRPKRNFRMPQLFREPMQEQMSHALSLLDEAIGDFPFLDASSKANALALMLTPIVRSAICGCVPMGLIDAPQQGTGKSLLANIISLIATGRPSPMMAAPDSDEEWRKRITSTLMSGATIITIDNLDGALRSASLASALTAEIWQDRILGKSGTVEVAQRSTWMATGNNIRLGGDLQRRCYWVRLDAGSSEPWRGRTFRHRDLLGWVKENRPGLVGALLTIARGWFAAGQPGRYDVPSIGGFESWCQTVGGILRFAGVGGFLGNLDSLYASADEDSAEWVEFLTALEARYAASFTAADVASALGDDLSLSDSLPSELADAWGRRNQTGASFSRRLGKAFSNHAQRRYGPAQHHIEQTGERQNAKLWRVASHPPFAEERQAA